MKTVMIVSGESSGELYGSLLAKVLKSRWPDIRLIGIGGERMEAAGVEMLGGISGALGLTELIPSIKKLRSTFKAAKTALTEASPDVVVLIDFPDFNFKLGKAAKKLGIKVLYYVSPQVWAWRKDRVRTMARFVDMMAVLLPFEEAIYKKAGIPCEFVGHPVMEEIEEYEGSMGASRRAPDSVLKPPTIALLPGSRPNELKSLLPVYIDTVRLIKKDVPNCRFVLPLAPNIDAEKFDSNLNRLREQGVNVVKGETVKALSYADAAIIASGTATLQAALLGIPAVVVYKLSPLSYLVGKMIIDVRHIALVNIIMDKEIYPELIQQRANAKDIAEEIKNLIHNQALREEILSLLTDARRIFKGKMPSVRVAEMIGELAGWKL